MTAGVARSYGGPGCPRCNRPLLHEGMYDGTAMCPHCNRPFEVRVFHPAERGSTVLQLAQSGPEEGTPCAYHARNAAVAACDRCGVFICSLCEMAIDTGRYCPSCLDRLSQEGEGGAARMRIRDYGGLAILSAGAGLLFGAGFFLGIPGGILSWYYAIRAFRHPENSSAGRTRLILAMFVGAVIFAMQVFFLYSLFATATGQK